MKKLAVLTMMLMLAAWLPGVVAAEQKDKAAMSSLELTQPGQNAPGQIEKDTKHAESEARKLQKAYFMKREAAKERRDAAEQLRQQNISTGNPGNTGM